ncbi:hypothetical protein [Nonomuraea sp. LPB2021202275-12-8]|uniref:hypothetical protein n=1 Tax=Nonomuraea sp. LPB2021202275-12-8 TaxID=3120159 RepID=UPI00300D871B
MSDRPDGDRPNLFDTRRFAGLAGGEQVLNVGFSSDLPLCDFCAGTGASMYFPVREFEILHPQMRASHGVVSGDRFYADPECGELFDAGQLGALRKRYVAVNGEPPSDMAIALWRGAREHRQGDPAHFPAGTNPEKDRKA